MTDFFVHIVQARWHDIDSEESCVVCCTEFVCPTGPAPHEGGNPVCHGCAERYNKGLAMAIDGWHREDAFLIADKSLSTKQRGEIHGESLWVLYGPNKPERDGVLDPELIWSSADYIANRRAGFEERALRPDWVEELASTVNPWAPALERAEPTIGVETVPLIPVVNRADDLCNYAMGYVQASERDLGLHEWLVELSGCLAEIHKRLDDIES